MKWWKRNKDEDKPKEEAIILTPRLKEEMVLMENLYAGATLYAQGIIGYEDFKNLQIAHMSLLMKRAEKHALDGTI